MKFAIEGGQRQFFKKHQFLEVEGVLTATQLKELNLEIEKVLEERLNAKPKRAFQELPTKVFTTARDLWRSSDSVKKISLSTQFAEIASDLIEFRPLRFGFDQLYSTVQKPTKDREGFNPYKELALTPRTLKETTCLQGVLCGLMICLSAKSEVENLDEEEKSTIFSKEPGNAVFFTPEMVVDFNELFTDETYRYLMIVYTHPTAIYFLEDNDPQTHAFKGLGYVFGDRLSDKLNPIIYR